MPIFKKAGLTRAVALIAVLWCGWSSGAEPVREPIHWSGDRTVWDRKNDRVVVEGNALLRKPRETLNADWMQIDFQTRRVHARGNCIYLSRESVITASEIFFHLDTSTGTILSGRVTNGTFLLTGDRIDRLELTRYVTHRGEYTACRDCPASWSVQGDNVDIEFEGYGHFSNVVGKIKDAPMIWFPYVVVPLKSKRQSGLLFPKMGFAGEHGFRFVPKFYWAISRSADMTIGLGTYTGRGFRSEWEGRFIFSETDSLSSQWNYTYDALLFGGSRWNLLVDQNHLFPLGIQERLHISEVSDQLIPGRFPDDLPGRGEPVLTSDLTLRGQYDVGNFGVLFSRHRNLLNTSSLQEFDPKTVQVVPQLEWGNPGRFWWDGPVAVGWATGLTHFTRTADAYDTDFGSSATSYTGGVDPLRKALRFYAKPTMHTVFRPWDAFSITPSLQYHGYVYSFYNAVPALARGYLLFQTEFSFQLEKIYDTDDPAQPKLRHVVRPQLVYSRIPFSHRPDSHPFLAQIDYRTSYVFDNEDYFPFTRSQSLINYTAPLGNSLSYGLVTQWTRRTTPIDSVVPGYTKIAELALGQSVDFWPSANVPLSRLYVLGDAAFQDFSISAQYYFYPYLERYNPAVVDPSAHEIGATLTWAFNRATGPGGRVFDRSLSATYAWSKINNITSNFSGRIVYSLSDVLIPSGRIAYDFHNRRIVDSRIEATFNSPSQCWMVTAAVGWALDRGQFVDFNLNILPTGAGNTSMGQLTGN